MCIIKSKMHKVICDVIGNKVTICTKFVPRKRIDKTDVAVGTIFIIAMLFGMIMGKSSNLFVICIGFCILGIYMYIRKNSDITFNADH